MLILSRFAPLLQKRATREEPSRVVVTASIGGLTVNPGPAYAHSYVASKAAVIHLARNLAVELAPRNILVNTLAPGVFVSKLSSGLIDMSGGADELGKESPNGRLGRPEDVAAAVVYLCSRAANHVVGQVLVLDGGNALVGPMIRRKEKL
jgi:NAD(P)-dependent dehydrogenase (short-subunit alcohol dehydrogenase family)